MFIWFKRTMLFVVLVISYAVIFAGGSRLIGPDLSSLPASGTPTESLSSLLLVSIIDVAIMMAIAQLSRLKGWRLMLLLGIFLYGVKTFSSDIEAWYYMQNITPEMLPGLFRMTLPLAILFPILLVWFTRDKDASDGNPVWRFAGHSTRSWGIRVLVLAAIIYPVLFFVFGYFVAWQSEAVRSFYGDPVLTGFFQHMAGVFQDPFIYPFEILRGLIWIALALPIMATTKGQWWKGTLLVALSFALIQNDVHLMPNPLMPAEVRLFHFMETSSSNFIWAFAIGFVLMRHEQKRRERDNAGQKFGHGTSDQ